MHQNQKHNGHYCHFDLQKCAHPVTVCRILEASSSVIADCNTLASPCPSDREEETSVAAKQPYWATIET